MNAVLLSLSRQALPSRSLVIVLPSTSIERVKFGKVCSGVRIVRNRTKETFMSTTNGSQDNDDDFETIFTAFITLKNGQRIFAASKGLKAFAIRVRKRG